VDQGTLVDSQLQAVPNLLAHLAANGVPVLAASWTKESDEGWWYLYVVTPLVRKDGATMPAYRRIRAAFQALPEPSVIDPFRIKAVGPSEPTGQALLDFVQSHADRPPSRYDGSRLGDVSVDAAYVYAPPAAPAPS
jgi:hypothetical protein